MLLFIILVKDMVSSLSANEIRTILTVGLAAPFLMDTVQLQAVVVTAALATRRSLPLVSVYTTAVPINHTLKGAAIIYVIILIKPYELHAYAYGSTLK